MKPCDISERALHAYLDGELKGAEAKDLARQIEGCPDCLERIEALQRVGDDLREMVDFGVGDVEPLVALRNIRQRIAQSEADSPWLRLSRWWEELWAYNRRAVAGVAAALVLGAASAPGVMFVLDRTGPSGDAALAGVVLESLEYDGNAHAAVYSSNSGSTTLIWVEPDPSTRKFHY